MAALTYDRRAFSRVKRRIKKADIDMLKAGPKVGAVVARHIRRQFTTKGAHFGTPWKPLAKSTLKEKARKGFPKSPLVRTGQMKAGVTKQPLDIEWFTNSSAHLGTDRKKAVWQHYGTHRNGRRHIPPRPILKLTPDLKQDIVDVLRRQALGISRKKRP